MATALQRDRATIPVLTAWNIAATALFHTPSEVELRWLERAVLDIGMLAPWISRRNSVLESHSDADEECVREIVRLNVRGSEIWTRLVDVGFLRAWQTANDWVNPTLRVIATIVYNPKQTKAFACDVYDRQPLPSWARQATGD